jgi:hypothetical protein
MPQYRFNVFGRLVVITGAPGNWSAFLLGTDGKRRRADFIVPSELDESELCRYLSDLFHEAASSTQPVVTRID